MARPPNPPSTEELARMYQEISSPSSTTDFEEVNAAFNSFHTPASLLGYINKPLPPIPDPKESKSKVSKGRHSGPKLSNSDPDPPLLAVEQLAPSFYLQPTTYSISSLAVHGLERPYQLANPSKPKSSETGPQSPQSAKERLYRDLGSRRANTDERRVLTLKDMMDAEEQEQLDATDRQRQQHMAPALYHLQPNAPAPPEQISPLPPRAYLSSHSPESSDYPTSRLIPPPLSVYKSPIPDRPVSRFSLNTTSSSYSSDSPNHHHKANRSSLIAYLRKSASSSKTSKGKSKRKSGESSSSPKTEHFPPPQQKKNKTKTLVHLQQTIRGKFRYPYFSSVRPPPPPPATANDDDDNPNPPHSRHASAPAIFSTHPPPPLSTRLNQRFADGTTRLRGAISHNLRLPRTPHARREALKRRIVRVGEAERYVDGKAGPWV